MAERLLCAVRALRQVHRILRDVEAATVPLEHRRFRLQRCQHRIGHAFGGLAQRIPADFRRLVALDRRAQHMCQQLRAEADAEHRLALFQHFLDRAHLVGEVRALRMVLHVHRSTQHHQPAVAVDVELGVRVALEVLEADAVTAPPDQRVERAQRFGGDVLEDE